MYLAARVIGVALVLGLVTVLPPLLLWLGNTLLSDDPLTYLAGHTGQFFAILGAGAILALFDAAIGCAVSGFTERKTYAAGALLGGAIAITTMTGILRGAIHAHWARYLRLIAPLQAPVGVANWFFAHPFEGNVPSVLYLIACVAIIALALLALRRAYAAVRF
jgi:hypothetical protein